jgi:dihydrolipoamide dehydrogenase
MDVVVIGAGPAGVLAAARAAELGARTTLLTRDRFGGMAANDGPVPVRTLAHAARLMREARQLQRYGITVSEPALNYAGLLARTREVVQAVREQSSLREQVDRLGVKLHENAGTVRFVDPRTVESEIGPRVSGERILLCTGGISRRLSVPGSELVATHSDAWSLTDVPHSMIVVGGGMTGLQVASIFHAFGSTVQLFQAGPRILAAEDEDVSIAVAAALRASGMAVHEGFGTIERFQRTAEGVRMVYAKEGIQRSADATLAVSTIGWAADTAGLNLARAGVDVDAKGFVRVDGFMRTSAPHVFAAGDITGRFMLAPTAMHEGYVAATNAVRGSATRVRDQVVPIGSFTDPEYARVGLTETQARASHDAVVAVVRFDETTRTIIDGQTTGFCKLIADRKTHTILGCSVVGERAVDIVQAVAIAMAGRVRVDDLARVPLSYPTYVGILGRAAYRAAREIGLDLGGETHA